MVDIFKRNKELGLRIEEFWDLSESEIITKYGIKSSIAQLILKQRYNTQDIELLMRELDTHDIKLLTYADNEYPNQLREITNPPFILYYFGNIGLVKRNPIAITGSRDISLNGLEIAAKFSKILVDQGLTVIRGNTKEIDVLAEHVTEESKGFQIVVLSEGILSHLQKVERLNKNINPVQNLLLSFVDPLLSWTSRTEQERNRVIFELSKQIVIIESRKDGIIFEEGMQALNLGKKVYVVRFEEYPPSATGNRSLIEKGAIPISPKDSIDNLREIIQSSQQEKHPVIRKSPKRKVEQRKDLGQFFTPLTVVKFMYDLVKALWGDKIPSNSKIIDPACGEGVFLKYASDNAITIDDNLYGCDIDESVREKWDLLQIRDKLKLFVHDGLLDSKELGMEKDKFDLAIGNPPYGGTGLSEFEHLLIEKERTKTEQITHSSLFDLDLEKTKEAEFIKERTIDYTVPLPEEKRRNLIQLANILVKSFELWKREATVEAPEKKTLGLFPDLNKIRPGKKRARLILEKIQQEILLNKEALYLSQKDLKKLISFPIEVLFIERFVQLAKPGGLIAIIIPDGILANTNLKYVRDWIFEKTEVLAIVSLPRETFKYIGTTAKTSILFLRKLLKGEVKNKKKPIFMAGANYVGINHDEQNDLPEILKAFQKFIRDENIQAVHMSPMITKATPEDVLRTGRMDPEYWDEKYIKLFKTMERRFKVNDLNSFIVESICGYRGKTEFSKQGIRCIEARCIRETGLDIEQGRFVPEDGKSVSPQRIVRLKDLLFVRSGVGCAGRVAAITSLKEKAVIGGHIFLTRLHGLNPFYAAVFLKGKYGWLQIERGRLGVGAAVLDERDIKAIQIPVLPDSIQQQIEREYKKMSRQHEKAMEFKKHLIDGGLSSKEAEKNSEYQKHIKKAEEMLKNLIKRTEEIIEGKRKDI